MKILTSCPSCLQGLARYRDDVAPDADYIVVEIAKHVLGADWLTGYVRDANAGGLSGCWSNRSSIKYRRSFGEGHPLWLRWTASAAGCASRPALLPIVIGCTAGADIRRLA